MKKDFYKYINEIDNSINPIKVAWHQAIRHLDLEGIVSTDFENALFKKIEQLNNNNTYHNAYHFAHVMIGGAYLLKYEIDNPVILPPNAFVLLLAALFHDAAHPGRSNQYPYELEKISAQYFNEYSRENKLELLWNTQNLETYNLPKWAEIVTVVKELIIATEFQQEAHKVVAQYKENPQITIAHDIKINVLKMLLIESDILLSCISETGIKQTEKMLSEQNLKLNKNEVHDKWTGFLHLVKDTHYQSQAASKLKLKEEIGSIISQNQVTSTYKPK